MEGTVTQTLASFAAATSFKDLPPDVVHETKRLFLDVVGCAVGSTTLKKGRIAVAYARENGGRPDSTILGTSHKVPAALAAFANGELMHTLDFCPLLPPAHIAPFVTAPVLALAETKQASGQTLLVAVALAHEVASRVGLSLDPMRIKAGGLVAPSWGLGFNAFGGAAGAAKILGLDEDAMSDAFGLAGYLAPVPSHNKCLNTPAGGGLAKYGPAGWTAQGSVTSAILASMGYDGDRTVLDGDFGFWAMAGSKNFDQGKIIDGLGKEWNVLRAMYKRWPASGLFEAPIGTFAKIVAEHNLRPEEIEAVLIKNEGQGMLPKFTDRELRHHIDAQTNLPYHIAMIAHGIEGSPAWQSDENMNKPSVRALMKKVTVEPYDRAEETRHQELVVERRAYIDRRPCFIQVTARGQVFSEAGEYAYWLSVGNPAYRASDADLARKFGTNAREALPPQKIERAVDKIMNLEKLQNSADLVAELVP